MGKSSSEDDDEDDEKFYGEASKGIPFAEFDRLMSNWVKSKYGADMV